MGTFSAKQHFYIAIAYLAQVPAHQETCNALFSCEHNAAPIVWQRINTVTSICCSSAAS